MRNRRTGESVRILLGRARYEVLPTPSCEDAVAEHVPTDVTVTITASPSKGLGATLDMTERLSARGYDVVPHLAARMISGRDELTDICARLTGLGVRTIFVPAGDADPPAGSYHSSLDLLEDLAALGNPFAEVGITGYPESHPSINDDLTVQAMWDKRRHATYVVSNLTFDPGLLQKWIRRMRQRGIRMPVFIGMPGPVDRTKLLMMATKIGVGESTRFLAKHRGTFARLAAPGGFTGERFLEKSVQGLDVVADGIAGLHIFTFNQIGETERWRRDLLARLGGPISAVS